MAGYSCAEVDDTGVVEVLATDSRGVLARKPSSTMSFKIRPTPSGNVNPPAPAHVNWSERQRFNPPGTDGSPALPTPPAQQTPVPFTTKKG
jgi:hypothetical protein